jgi:hypothetical protein
LDGVSKAKGHNEVDSSISILSLTDSLGKVRAKDESWAKHHFGTLEDQSSIRVDCRVSPAG